MWSTFIFAKDENGGPTGIENYVEFEVTLKDINDNAPFLDMPNGLVWTENQAPGNFKNPPMYFHFTAISSKLQLRYPCTIGFFFFIIVYVSTR